MPPQLLGIFTVMILMISDRYSWANSADPDQTAPRKQQSDQGQHCLPFHLDICFGHLTLCDNHIFFSNFRIIMAIFFGCPYI